MMKSADNMTWTMNFETGEGSGGVNMKSTSLAKVAAYCDEQHERFVKGCSQVHRKSVFQILIRLLKICPVDTGRLRGSFTPFMDDHGFQGYAPFIESPSEEGETRKTPRSGFSNAAYRAGKAQGEWTEESLNTTIGTNVVYAPYVEARTNFLSKLLVWADMQYNANFEKFFAAAIKQGWIPLEDPAKEGA